MTSETETPPGVCYRHRSRESWVLCQRCGRTICPSCQTQAAVGVQCPECVREGRASMPSHSRRIIRSFRSPRGSTPVVTYSLIAITLVVAALNPLTGGAILGAAVYIPAVTGAEPWRMITAMFVHVTLLHVLFTMLSLFFVGRILEPMLGRLRFAVLYLVSGFAGAVGVLLAPFGGVAIGASGAVFGAFAAFGVLARRSGSNVTGLLVIAGLTLVASLFLSALVLPNLIGGIVGGLVVGLIYERTRLLAQSRRQVALVAGFVLALALISLVAYTVQVGSLAS